MILSKSDLDYYIKEDAKQSGYSLDQTVTDKIHSFFYPDYKKEYMVTLRKLEYYGRGGVKKLFLKRKIRRLSALTGIELSPGVAGYGLHIVHGKIVVHWKAKIGNNCKLQSDVTIGVQGRYDIEGAPQIGNRVFIGSGARIIGNIHIADDVVIAANAVVIKSIDEPNTTWGGIPAKKISNNGSYHFLNRN